MNPKTHCALALLFILLFINIGFCGHIEAKQVPMEVPLPKGVTLINHLEDMPLSMKLLYGDISKETLHLFDLSPSGFSLQDQHYTSYEGGYIDAEKDCLLLQAVNHYRHRMNLEMITSFDFYTEIEGTGFLGLSEGLDTLYRIDLQSLAVTCPSYTECPAPKTAIFSCMTKGPSAYYLLMLSLEDRTAYWYALDLEDFSVLSCKPITLTDKVTSPKQCALDAAGNLYLVGHYELLMYTQDSVLPLSLSFDPDEVRFEDGKIYTFSLSDLFLSYAIYNDALEVMGSGQANLPNKKVQVTSIHLKDDYLYTISHDEMHPLYRDYITVYQAAHHQIIYCLALKDLAGTILLDGMPLTTS